MVNLLVLVLFLNYYKAILSYKGTNYFGWQKQTNVPTIQEELEIVLKKISNTTNIQVIGASRTDAGVHANGQVAKIITPKEFTPTKLKKAFNQILNNDIHILSLENATEGFSPAHDALLKEYRYYFSFSKDKIPFFNDLITYLNFNLHIDLIREACAEFVGEYDFVNFRTLGTPVNSTIREIKSIELTALKGEDFLFPKNTYYISFFGRGFLKQMIRLIIASIWSYSTGKIELNDIRNALLHQKINYKLAPTAPPQGLYLHQIDY